MSEYVTDHILIHRLIDGGEICKKICKKKKKMIHEPKHCSCLDSHFSKTNTSAELSPAAPGCVVCIP